MPAVGVIHAVITLAQCRCHNDDGFLKRIVDHTSLELSNGTSRHKQCRKDYNHEYERYHPRPKTHLSVPFDALNVRDLVEFVPLGYGAIGQVAVRGKTAWRVGGPDVMSDPIVNWLTLQDQQAHWWELGLLFERSDVQVWLLERCVKPCPAMYVKAAVVIVRIQRRMRGSDFRSSGAAAIMATTMIV